MEQLELAVQRRNVVGKQVRRLRREGLIPAVIYGHGVESLPIQVHRSDLRGILDQASLSRLVALRVDDEEETHVALVREVQRDVLTDDTLHVDFLEVQMAETLTTTVPVHVLGTAPAVEQQGGMLLQGITEVEIECLPADLIDSIEVDISSLTELEQELTVADLISPASIEILTPSQEMVVRVMSVPEEEEEIEEEFVSVSPTEVEVIGRPQREEDVELDSASQQDETA
jgi:large subunit ribosomal protein L25